MRKFFSCEEVTEKLAKLGIYCGLAEIANYTQEKFIKPVIYINSLPAHACEMDPCGEEDAYNIFFCGFCYLTAYWKVCIEDTIGMINMLICNKSIKLATVIFKNQFLEEPLITSWQINHSALKKVPPDRYRPRQSKEEAKIEGFVLLEDLTIDNVRISQEDYNFLKNYLLEESVKMAAQKACAEKIIKQRNYRIKKNLANAKKSAVTRKQQAEEQWQKEKLPILELAKLHPGKTPNAIAIIAFEKNLILKSQSHIAKLIRKDHDFQPFIRKTK